MSKATDTAGSQAFELASLDTVSDGLRAGVQALYEEAFPPRQREPFADIVAASRDGAGIALVPVDGEQPVGLAFLSSLGAAGPLFLEYFAIAADRRGAGVGQALWHAVADALAVRGEPAAVVLEVEDPAEAQIAAEEVAQRERRVRFWQRVGARMLPVSGYIVPTLDEDGTEPLLLMWIAPPGAADPDLHDLVVALYEHGYRLDPDHPLVVRAHETYGR